MDFRLIEIITGAGQADTLRSIAENRKVLAYWSSPADDGRVIVRMLSGSDERQALLDDIQRGLGPENDSRVVILPVEATLPRLEPESATQPKTRYSALTREELYADIESGARLDRNYVLLVLLATMVATIGMIEDNIAVVIGAMVIAPLLGPQLALGLAAALGDGTLMTKALRTALAGLLATVVTAFVIGLVWPQHGYSAELMARTRVGYDGMALALASGAAGVLSLTSGLPTVLVGVMVAVALMPPAATVGWMLAHGAWDLAFGAALLGAVNIVCINLAAVIVFLFQGVRPRTWYEKRKASQSMRAYLAFWLVSLLILAVAIYLQPPKL